jgi:topoisomerase-4 subunit B
MDINKRFLIKIKIEDGHQQIKKTDKLFESLMGKKAESRYNFIQENANFSNNLDI